ncbi:hypothetical protein MNBD_UNCLBAC01-1860 [hydrothermal vent metagenome]|uniref:Uncharacterized protein n=1 Tax=hydrothermal vent metagenome TaxID=652676 RepID=A0A3B1D266_9ZZZZ
MVIPGHVENNTIVMDQKINLVNGTKVNIVISIEAEKKNSGLYGIWKDDRDAKKIVEDLISSRSKGRDVQL